MIKSDYCNRPSLKTPIFRFVEDRMVVHGIRGNQDPKFIHAARMGQVWNRAQRAMKAGMFGRVK